MGYHYHDREPTPRGTGRIPVRQRTRTPVPRISVRELSKSYGDIKAVDSISLDIEEKEIFRDNGPSRELLPMSLPRDEILGLVGLKEKAGSMVDEPSGGQRGGFAGRING